MLKTDNYYSGNPRVVNWKLNQKDTAESSCNAEGRQRDDPGEDDQTLEQDFELFAWQTRANVVDECVDLAQSEHAKSLKKYKHRFMFTSEFLYQSS